MPATRLYLHPLGVIAGEPARQAIAAGFGLPLGPDEAFLACALWYRTPDTASKVILSAAGLEPWAAERGLAFEQALAQRLVGLASASPMPGLPADDPAARKVAGPLIMGVVNVTPDSFSDGGCFLDPGAAIAHGELLDAEGAAILDVGGESTRPGAAAVSVEEEIQRVVPVVRGLADKGFWVSIDTRKAGVMRAALDAGADMINDISALRHDPDSLAVAGAAGCPVILMHSKGEPATMQDRPRYDRVALDVFDHLEERIRVWEEAGFERTRLLIDPGIGFGKTHAHNLEILHQLDLYRSLGLPLVLGASRKSFIGRIGGDLPAGARLPGSLAAALFGRSKGVAMLRVHDVGATRQALWLWEAMADERGDWLQQETDFRYDS